MTPRMMLAAGLLAAAAVGPARAQAAPRQYTVIYGELRPSAVGEQQGRDLLAYLASLAGRSAGSQYFAVNSEIGRPNRFTLVEVWRDAASLQAFTGASSTLSALAILKTLLIAPLDERDGNLVQ